MPMVRRTAATLGAALLALSLVTERAGAIDLLELGETFVEAAQKVREVDSVSPSFGTTLGGTRLSIAGEGFATEFFDGSNSVKIGTDSSGYVDCDVIEGACTVDCGSAYRIVCDTGEWTSDSSTGWLNVVVTIDESTEEFEVVCSNCFAYKATSDASSPRLTSITPRHAGANEVLLVHGDNFGSAIDDYTNIYVGAGRPPQGGNIDTGSTNTHAVCRPDALNFAVDDVTGELPPSNTLPVMAEDAIIGHDTPILEDVIQCALGDFMAGSYNLSAFLGTKTRTAYGGLSYNDAKNLSRDANGVVYALQYCPTIATVTPAGGSLEGGTMLTITGGGFPIDTADVVVTVGGVRCRVVTSTLETITCLTTDPYPNDDSGVPEPHYVADDNWAAAAAAGKYYIAYDEHAARTFGGDALARASLIVDNDASATRKTARGPWRSVSVPDESSSDYGGGYLVADGCNELSCEPAWISFAPHNLALSGVYELAVHVPPFDAELENCSARASSAPVLVRDAARGYVLSNISMATTAADAAGWRPLGNFTLTAGAGSRHAAVVIDSLGADGCVVADAVRWVRVNASMDGGCADPFAANYDPLAPLNAYDGHPYDDDGAQFGTCLYLGGRGLTHRAWSLLGPEFRDGGWLKDLDTREPYATGGKCKAPALNSTAWLRDGCKDGFCDFHEPCLIDPATGYPAGTAEDAAALGATGGFCCLTNEHWGCDPTWNKADEDGWVTILKQHADDPLFEPDEWRKNAHGGAEEWSTFAILDDLEVRSDLVTYGHRIRVVFESLDSNT